MLCASPSYLEKHDLPNHPEELTNHSCLHYGHIVTGNQWHFIGKDGVEHRVNVRGALCSNNGEVLKDAAIQGLGIALLPMFIIESALQQKLLTILDVGDRPPEISLCLVYPLNRHLSTKIKIFREFIETQFSTTS